MELRRAILLFAIVLGLAAIATSVSRPPPRQGDGDAKESRGAGSPSTPTANPRDAAAAAEPLPRVVFERSERRDRPETETLEAGSAATVVVETSRPGEVSVEGLGLEAFAEPLAPARFEVLTSEPDRHRIRFTPTAGEETRTIGVLQIRPET